MNWLCMLQYPKEMLSAFLLFPAYYCPNEEYLSDGKCRLLSPRKASSDRVPLPRLTFSPVVGSLTCANTTHSEPRFFVTAEGLDTESTTLRSRRGGRSLSDRDSNPKRPYAECNALTTGLRNVPPATWMSDPHHIKTT